MDYHRDSAQEMKKGVQMRMLGTRDRTLCTATT